MTTEIVLLLLWPIAVAAAAGALAHFRRPTTDGAIDLQHKLAMCEGELRSTRQSRDDMVTLLMGAVRAKAGA